MMLVLCLVGSVIFAAFALGGAKGWRRALQNGSEEDVVQSYRRSFYRSAGLVLLVGTVAFYTATTSASVDNAKGKEANKPQSRVSGGIS